MEINNAWKFSWQYQRAIREMMMNDRILNMLLHSDKKIPESILGYRNPAIYNKISIAIIRREGLLPKQKRRIVP